MLRAIWELFYVYLSRRKGSDQPGMGHTDSLLYSFIFPKAFFLPESSPRAFIWRYVIAASFSSLGPDCSLPSVFSTLSSFPACHMHVQPRFSLHHLESSAEVQAVAAVVACHLLYTALGLSPPSTYGSTPALPCCLCKCWTRRQTHTNPQLSTSWRADFWNFPFENLHFWGLSVLSPAYQ